MASALSFFFLDSVPDDGLWAKALVGTLTQPMVLAAEVDRLLTLPEVKTGLSKKAGTWIGLPKLARAQKDGMLFSRFSTAARDALVQGEDMFLGQILWNGRLSDLITSRRMYVNQELATLYGVPGVTGTAVVPIDVTLPERNAGILSHPALLAAHSGPTKGDVIHRGLFVYNSLVCGQAVPPPPAALAPVIQAQPKVATERELAVLRSQTASCSPCHALFDGFGLIMDRYDAIGRYREIEQRGQSDRSDGYHRRLRARIRRPRRWIGAAGYKAGFPAPGGGLRGRKFCQHGDGASTEGRQRLRLARSQEHLRRITVFRRHVQGSSHALAALPTAVAGASLELAQHEATSRQMLQIIRTAFQCDLTRVATFQFANALSGMQFTKIIPGFSVGDGHHDISHQASKGDAAKTAIERFYVGLLTEFLVEMKNTPDGPGTSLLDNTLVFYFTEINDGNEHGWANMPIAIFGGKSFGITGGASPEV